MRVGDTGRATSTSPIIRAGVNRGSTLCTGVPTSIGRAPSTLDSSHYTARRHLAPKEQK